MVEKMFNPDIIDINYGCPVPKITKTGAGSSAMKDLCIMDEIIGFTKDWNKLIQEKIVYPEVHNKINKYKPFVTHTETGFPSYDYPTYKKRLIELCSI